MTNDTPSTPRSTAAVVSFAMVAFGILLGIYGMVGLYVPLALTGVVLALLGLSYFLLKSS